ncbi:hypothetical protein H072_2454 [Dactylellina haptotyla CBS 200.50]|uniref:DUF676 domain-containing protein n=1 Tax=Dactylellina haptotyla (strain CBS 200.50) TaxID=1284197 RepID=S8AKY0_DACHA|nr:hypothetical protein H072_2454 [Dactylellina haptotyla CBS 200.50]
MNFLQSLRSPSPTVAAIVNDPAHPSHQHDEPFLTNESLARRSLLQHHEATRKDADMLLLHTTGSVKIGELLRYKVTYFPSRDRILPLPTALHLRIKNKEVIPLRAAYLHGPYVLYCSVKSEQYSHWSPVINAREEGGYPEFEPNLKAGSTWECELPIPPTMRREVMARERERRARPAHKIGDRVEGFGQEEEKITWIVEVVSQMIFSSTARISFDLAVARDERSLNHYGTGFEQGTFSNAIAFSVMNTKQIWNLPPFPGEEKQKTVTSGAAGVNQQEKLKNKGPKKVHLVLITHGIHSNCGADMLFVKESIDRTAKELREAHRQKRRESKKPVEVDIGVATGDVEEVSDEDDDDDDEEQIITRGFHGNVCKTERGIKYLGKRLARYAFTLAYPDRPLPASLRSQRSTGLWRSPTIDLHEPNDKANYKVTSISFIGHSLGGLVQTYAIAYIHAHDPNFFQEIQPYNFVALATPFLGLSNENPIYVKFALDFGFVGRTGQDLGLTWRAPNMATSAMSGFSLLPSNASVKSEESQGTGAKPLLRILPMGPAKEVLKMFRNRTVYANVVNDGVVPLRTSCLLFLDWKGLGRVEKARRANEGPIGQVSGLVGWGLGQLTSGTSTPRRNWHRRSSFDETTLAESEPDGNKMGEAPLTKGPVQRRYSNSHELIPSVTLEHAAPSALSSFWTLFKPYAGARHDRKVHKILSRSQTMASSEISSAAPSTSSLTASSQPTITEDLVDSPPIISPAPSSATLADSMSSGQSSSTVTAANSSKTGDTTISSLLTDDPTMTARGKATAADDGPDAENYEKMMAPPRTTLLEAAGDILNPPLPSLSFLINPETRPRTIFHDRVYHPSDIPPLPAPTNTKRAPTPGRISRSASYNSETGELPTPTSNSTPATTKSSSATLSAFANTSSTKDGRHSPTYPRSPTRGTTSTSGRNLKPEEKIARAFHDSMSWRKVLVRLEPDAHNNIIVRREFSNAYGWPVVKHLVETHFGDTVAARTRDDEEEGEERALEVDTPTARSSDDGKRHWKGGEREVEDALAVKDDERDGRSSGSATPRRKDRPMSPVWSDRGDCSSDSEDDDEDEEHKRSKEEKEEEKRRMEVIDSFLGKVPADDGKGKKKKKRISHDETDVEMSGITALGVATKIGIGLGAGDGAGGGPTLQARHSLERVRDLAEKQKHE